NLLRTANDRNLRLSRRFGAVDSVAATYHGRSARVPRVVRAAATRAWVPCARSSARVGRVSRVPCLTPPVTAAQITGGTLTAPFGCGLPLHVIHRIERQHALIRQAIAFVVGLAAALSLRTSAHGQVIIVDDRGGALAGPRMIQRPDSGLFSTAIN